MKNQCVLLSAQHQHQRSVGMGALVALVHCFLPQCCFWYGYRVLWQKSKNPIFTKHFRNKVVPILTWEENYHAHLPLHVFILGV